MTFYIETLGCKVNTYESNVMADLLRNASFKEGTKKDATVTIINTCTVTNTADHKSLKAIRRIKKENPNTILVVVGCLPQTGLEKVKDMDVSIILGNVGKSKIVEYIEQYRKTQKKIIDIRDIENTPFETMKLNNFNHTRAFVKIQDGCNNYCSYCIIPYTRGSVRSKPIQDVLTEITHLVKQGHLEIVLTGIHTGHYGSDIQESFSHLLSEIVKIDGLKRLRISSIEMNEITDEVLTLLSQYPILVDHMHIPLQSGSDAVLKAMNRKYNKQEFTKKIEKIKAIRPNMAITTDVIVGFPNETEEQFEETIETIKKIGFAKIHVFPYSKRNQTTASLLPDIKDEIKKSRVQTLLELSKELELEYMQKQLGKEVSYLPEKEINGYWIGHTGNYLLVKQKIKNNCFHKERTGKIIKIEYPYMILEEEIS